jgi:hypothetical protein
MKERKTRIMKNLGLSSEGWAKIAELNSMGWSVQFNIDWDGACEIYGHAGDSNCPYNKEYDPSDGHGTSSAFTEDLPLDNMPDDGYTVEEAVSLFYDMVKKIKPGKKRWL